jgi:crotonobetainyl-CoA:carnitine CoA-transferase CaiB-like acyl-CoA transferase
VQDMSDLMEHDAQLRARNPLVPLVHPLLGEFGHMRTPIDFSRATTAPFRAPGMGEHNRQVATEICGLSASRFEELEMKGVLK